MENYMPVLFFESFYVKDDTIYMSARDFNGLFKGNLKNGEMQFIGFFPGEDLLAKRLHYGEAVCKEEKIYFIPLESKYIHVFNILTSSFEKIKLDSGLKKGYAKAVFLDDQLYMISTRTTEILQYDLKTGICKVVFRSKVSENYGYAPNIYIFDRDIYLMLSKKNIMRRFNTLNFCVDDYQVGERLKQYQIVAGKDENIYYVNKDSPEIFLWDILSQKEKEKKRIQHGIKLNSWQWGKLVIGNSLLGEGITILDIENLQTNKFYTNKEPIQRKEGIFEIQNAFIYGQDLYYVWSGDSAVYSIFKKGKSLHFFLTENVLQQIRTEILSYLALHKRFMFEENSVFGLSEFMEYLSPERRH